MAVMLLALAMGVRPHGRVADGPPRPLVHTPAKGALGTGMDARRIAGQNRNGKDIVASATHAKDLGPKSGR